MRASLQSLLYLMVITVDAILRLPIIDSVSAVIGQSYACIQ